ncbi:hypothetical protein ACFO25_09145 [Paenactinomyces guangxiensis]|uniref:Uncharacterized protein n=1 Tax=Paenactinomyces guangxiensis TaxID=1490290 RepID=A0A7W1WMR9_9BACL|nr:hypothetical protein [Paenactinomyces guangxiensis]MBA4492790.1 hypothetical protein [Paenactinomyces guangxiensis]MBH8590361.1 hypothetical protein [Paenactinomyces guangxiensis]
MSYSNFIPVKRLAGDLLISQKRNNLGFTLTTKEFVFQKPHLSYHILLDDVIGVIPYEIKKSAHLPKSFIEESWTHRNFSAKCYKISVGELHIINRQGLYTRGATDLILPLNDRFMQFVKNHTDLTMLPV